MLTFLNLNRPPINGRYDSKFCDGSVTEQILVTGSRLKRIAFMLVVLNIQAANAKFSAVEKLRKSDRPLRRPPLLEAVFNINRVAFPDIHIARKL